MPRVDPLAAPSRCARCSAPLPARAPSAADAWPASGARCRRGRRPIRRTGAPHDPENVPGRRAGMTHQPQVQAHRHHAGPLRAFAVQHVERVLQVFKEILARGHAAADELGVVVGQAVRQHQMRAAIHPHVVGQLVVVGVGVVQEAAFLGHQPARVDAGTVAAIPAQRTRADRGLDRGDGAADALALFGLGQRLVALPAPAVRAHVPAGVADGGADLRVAFQRQPATEDGGRHAVRLQQPRDAPEADAAAILEHGFGRQVAAGEAAAPPSVSANSEASSPSGTDSSPPSS